MAVPPNEPTFKDPFVTAYYNSLVDEVKHAQQIFDSFSPSGTNKPDYLKLSTFVRATKIINELHEFEERVRKKGHQLQYREITPNLQDLQVELYDILYEHHREFVAGYQKVCQLVSILSKILQRCEPITQNLELERELMTAEVAFARTYHPRLKHIYDAACKLRNNLSAKLEDNSSGGYKWTIQRFAQIVAQFGQPQGYLSRAYNNLTYPVIPPLPAERPKAVQSL